MSLKEIIFLAQHSSHKFTIKDCINMYEWMLKCGRIKEGGAADRRLRHLRLLYSKGERKFKRSD